MREIWATIPAAQRKRRTGLEARELIWTFVVTKWLTDILLDCIYNLTDAGIAAGETFDGWVKSFEVKVNGHRVIFCERDTLFATCKYAFYTLSAQGGPEVDTPANTTYASDALPVTTVDRHVFFKFLGNWEPGKYEIILKMNPVTSEWGGAAAMTADFGVSYTELTNPVGAIPIALVGKVGYAATEIKLNDVNGGYIDVVANLSGINHGKNPIEGTAQSMLQRQWNELLGIPWNAALQTDLGFVLNEKADLTFTWTVAAATFYVACGMRIGQPVTTKRVWKRRRSTRRPTRRRATRRTRRGRRGYHPGQTEIVSRSPIEAQAYEEEDDDQGWEDEYELVEMAPFIPNFDDYDPGD